MKLNVINISVRETGRSPGSNTQAKPWQIFHCAIDWPERGLGMFQGGQVTKKFDETVMLLN
jgi:hypothetical protein